MNYRRGRPTLLHPIRRPFSAHMHPVPLGTSTKFSPTVSSDMTNPRAAETNNLVSAVRRLVRPSEAPPTRRLCRRSWPFRPREQHVLLLHFSLRIHPATMLPRRRAKSFRIRLTYPRLQTRIIFRGHQQLP